MALLNIICASFFMASFSDSLTPVHGFDGSYQNEQGFVRVGQQLFSPLPSSSLVEEDLAQHHTEFGSVVQLSSNGQRVAIGASKFSFRFDNHTLDDLSASLVDEPVIEGSGAFPNDNSGAVFLYELLNPQKVQDGDVAGVKWRLLWALFGSPGEGIGDRLSISEDGRQIAVRRYNLNPSVVEVYQYSDSTKEAYAVGTPISCSDSNSDGKTVKLGTTAISTVLGSTSWLVLSCEKFERKSGKVEIFKLNKDIDDWEFFSSIEGSQQGSRFGWATDFVDAPNPHFDGERIFRLAVSAPYHNNRGAVRVYDVDRYGSTRQIGSDMVGYQDGEQFGYSMAMSSNEQPYLVVGSPRCDGSGIDRGCVRIFNWRIVQFGGSFTWHMVGNEAIAGMVDNDRFGRSVAITMDGGRIAASSSRHHGGTGVVGVYDRVSFDRMAQVGEDITGDDMGDRWGFSVALNRRGGAFVTSGSIRSKNKYGKPVGSVRVFLDTSPFCSIPGIDDLPAERNELLFDRNLCRSRDTIVGGAQECSLSRVYRDGEIESCVWKTQPLFLPTRSSHSTLQPSSRPTEFPTSALTFIPSPLPTHLEPWSFPSGALSLLPSYSLTKSPTKMPTATLFQEPSFVPTNLHSMTTTMVEPPILVVLSSFPSKVPSELPSLLPSIPPSKVETPDPSPEHSDVDDAELNNVSASTAGLSRSQMPSYSPTQTPATLPTQEASFVPTTPSGKLLGTPRQRPQIELPFPATNVAALPTNVQTLPPTATQKAQPLVQTILLQGCHCDQLGRCISQPIMQGFDLRLCLATNQFSVDFLEVVDWRLEQKETRILVIDSSGLRMSGVTDECRGGTCTMQAPISSLFFSPGNPSTLVASGTVALVLSNDSRGLRGASRHNLQTDSTQGKFVVTVPLQQTTAVEKHSESSNLITWLLVAVVALVSVLLLSVLYSKIFGSAKTEK